MSIKATELLSCVFIYCPDIEAAEGEEFNKLLFYHPKTDAPNIQIQNFSFCEAVVKFTKTFSSVSVTNSFYQVKTSKSHCVCCCFEERFYIGAFFDLAAANSRDYALEDQVLHSILCRAVDTFRLFFGSAGKLFVAGGSSEQSRELKARFDYFFTRYFMTLRLSLFPLMDMVGGIRYADVDPVRFLDIQCTVNRMLDSYSFLRHVLIIQDDSLVYSSVAGSNLVTFYRYLVVNLLPVSNRIELTADGLRSGATTSTTSGDQVSAGLKFGKFTTGIDCEPPSTKIPNLFMRKDDGGSGDSEYLSSLHSSSQPDYCEYSLVLYKILNITVALLFFSSDSHQIQKAFYSDFDASFGPAFVSTLGGASDMVKSSATAVGATGNATGSFNDSDYSRFFYYFNRSTSGYLCSATDSGSEAKYFAQLPRAVRVAVCNLYRELRLCDYFGDVFAKVDSEYWLAAKKSGTREVYAVFALRNAHLSDINEEMRKLCTVHFDGTFIVD